MKKSTTLTIDNEVISKCKDKNLNISEFTERALREKLDKVEVEIDKSIDSCEICGREMEKATSENVDKGLTWLWPDERWICPRCLKRKTVY